MITSLVRGGLRLIAVVALFVLGAMGVISINTQYAHARAVQTAQAEKLARLESMPQTYTVPAEVAPPKPFTYDLPQVVVPKPKPTHTAIKRQAVAVPRKASIPRYSIGAAQAYARGKVSSGQYGCLVLLWNRESGWNVHAENSASGAYGIPQALPGSKMASSGAAWRDSYVTQVNWGLSYISGRYGTPCAAWAHSQAIGWY